MTYIGQMPNAEHMTTSEVAAEFRVDVRTVHRWTAEDASPRLVPLFKTPGLRGAYVFTRAAVEKFRAAKALADQAVSA